MDKIYKDSLGYPTFGIGHLITPSDPEYGKPVGTPVSPERTNAVFKQDFDKHLAMTRNIFPKLDSYPENVQRVLTNMTFNLGEGGLASFHRFDDAIKRGSYREAA